MPDIVCFEQDLYSIFKQSAPTKILQSPDQGFSFLVFIWPRLKIQRISII